MVERSPDGRALRQVRSGRVEAAQFACSAGTICFIAAAEVRDDCTGVGSAIDLLVAALLLMPVMQFRPQLFDFLFLSATIALLARYRRRASGMLWVAIPLIAIWSNLHGGFFYRPGCDRGLRPRDHARGSLVGTRFPARSWNSCDCGRGDGVDSHHILIPPARDSWLTLIHSILNPMTHYTIGDWIPLIPSLMNAPWGSVEQKYFVLVLFFFAAASVCVALTPRGGDLAMVAVAAAMLGAAFMAVRNVPMAVIATVRPAFANHLALLLQKREFTPAGAASARPMPRAGRPRR